MSLVTSAMTLLAFLAASISYETETPRLTLPTLSGGVTVIIAVSYLMLPLRKHRWHGKSGGALECDGNEAECVCVPLKPGSCTFHSGGVVHYSRGNSTAGHRRALIINFRPEAMIRLEREQGFDHGKTINVRENRT